MSVETNTLDEMCELIVDCPHFTPEWTTSGYLVIRNQNIRDGRLDLSERSYTHLADFERRIRRAKPRAGDIIFTREAPMGEVCLVPEGLECCVGQRQVLLRPAQGVNHKYLFYALRSPFVRHQIFWNEGTGSTVSNVRIPVLKAIKIPRLGKIEPAIGELLASFDDKIDLNRRMNETLEAMAQAIFRDWFVDFGPVRRKLAGITDPVAIMGGLAPDPARAAELAALFPDRFGEDEMPEGWTVGTLEDWADVNPESWSTRNHPDWVNYVDLSNTKWGIIEATEKLPWANAPSRARRVIRPFDTIVATTRPGNGSYAYISQDGYTASTGFAVLRPKQRQFSQLVYCAAVDPVNIARLAQLADGHGGAYPAVNPGEVGASPIVNCGTEVAKAFEALAQPLRTKIEHTKVENRTLAETRDYLLPRLMSGEVRVSDVAQELAA